MSRLTPLVYNPSPTQKSQRQLREFAQLDAALLLIPMVMQHRGKLLTPQILPVQPLTQILSLLQTGLLSHHFPPVDILLHLPSCPQSSLMLPNLHPPPNFLLLFHIPILISHHLNLLLLNTAPLLPLHLPILLLIHLVWPTKTSTPSYP